MKQYKILNLYSKIIIAITEKKVHKANKNQLNRKMNEKKMTG